MSANFIWMFLFALFGFLPLAIVLYKRWMVHKIMTTGQLAKARIYDIRSTRPVNYDMRTPLRRRLYYVHYTFYGNGYQQYTGMLT
ncbi:MAG: hypothetical protein ACXWV2_10515, partial [Chitinophagaceae bacterium]